MKAKTKSSKVNKAWLHGSHQRPLVKLAAKEGYRARAAYKLREIDETLGLIRPGHLVVDLGLTPGAWSQYVRRKLTCRRGDGGAERRHHCAGPPASWKPIEGVTFIQGDFREADVLQRLEAEVAGRKADVVVFVAMAPNLSGIASADAARVEHLVELAVEFAQNHSNQRGAGGQGVPWWRLRPLVALFRAHFKVVKPFKPKASRDKSSETFLIGIGLKKRDISLVSPMATVAKLHRFIA